MEIWSGICGVLCALGLAGAAPAQSQAATFTMPLGLGGTEGNSLATFVQPFGYVQSRFQYTDGAQRGVSRLNVKSLELRRDGLTSGSFASRSANVAVVMAECDTTQLTTSFAANYKGAPTTVFTRKPLNLPDLSVAPPSGPAPWGITLPFDLAWSYSGTWDLLWEVQVDGNTGVGVPYALDAVEIVVPGLGSFEYNGLFSCTTPAGTFDIFGIEPQTSQAGVATFGNYALRGPPQAPGVFGIGVGDPNFKGPLCAPLRTSGEVLIPINTDANGAIGSISQPIGASFQLFAPLTLYTQFAALDASQANIPIALSDAVRSEVVEWVPDYKVSRLSTTLSANGPIGVRSAYYVLVARFTY